MRLPLIAAVAATALLAGPASADISVPGAAARPPVDEPEEIRCGSDEWLAIRRAVAAFCDPLTDELGCREVRRSFRTCEGSPVFTRDEPRRYSTTIWPGPTGFRVDLQKGRSGFRVRSIEVVEDAC
jgi:hypothetical protein